MKIRLFILILLLGILNIGCDNDGLIRDTGYPSSGNGASSMHLMPSDDMQEQRFIELSVIFMIEVEPRVDDIYFWAISADFFNGDIKEGMGHLGLYLGGKIDYFQHKKGAQWTGYEEYRKSFSDDTQVPYVWEKDIRYKMSIKRSIHNPIIWKGYIINLDNNEITLIATLNTGGSLMGGSNLGIWSEVFAQCDSPSVKVSWSDFQGITESNEVVKFNVLRTNYQSYERGGCTNTNSEIIEAGIRQSTNTKRVTQQGTILKVP